MQQPCLRSDIYCKSGQELEPVNVKSRGQGKGLGCLPELTQMHKHTYAAIEQWEGSRWEGAPRAVGRMAGGGMCGLVYGMTVICFMHAVIFMIVVNKDNYD